MDCRSFIWLGLQSPLNHLLHHLQLIFVEFSGDFVGAVDPAAKVHELAALGTEREERLIAQPFEPDRLFANGASGRSHFELAEEVEEELEAEDEELDEPLSPDLDEEELELLSAFAALLYESER